MPESQRPHCLTRIERVRRREDFKRVYDNGMRVRNQFGTLFFLKNGLDRSRLGVAATRKLGGAVVRNRAKRIVRDVFRRNKIAQGYDVIVVPNRGLLEASQSTFEAEFCQTLERRLRR